MSGYIRVAREVWANQKEGALYIGGYGNWEALTTEKSVAANNVNGHRDGIAFERDGDDLLACVKPELLVILRTQMDGEHQMRGLPFGFKWDHQTWTGGTIELIKGLVKISQESGK